MTTLPTAISVRALGSTALLLLLAGCGALDYSADLAENQLFYADVPFRTDAPGDRAVFVAPVADGRDPASLPRHEQGLPIRYGNDQFWERPVPRMLTEIVVRQLDDSHLFTGLSERAEAEAVVVKPTLVAFHVGAQEGMSGSMTFAEVGLRLEVFGPAAADGQRPLWHDEVYANRQKSEYEIKPVSPYRLVGRALQVTMASALDALDGSNVARSGVPIDVVTPAEQRGGQPAEASADRR